uniref:Uncharacterized protein n=1 Tax=Pseudictyota dubia TaxID=2749911 RepID=A0A6U2HPC0_9STRA|mmetsp:Transcript_48349/g.89646  ORF Transcript_48349/g.89646 Transcript_48349/m.89646 type:complete len:419 (+) Transcript_48349:107-1363(+)|eukprot:CAMPEP_0197445220 /NCGR_PEP_ID=MMETSP1175-20131217/10489_1 /TAXON_ID=1003142 /ORGANISM="Triceratium dubium, Strain CCMP147" /LENGTH=418 /DNA_ID=CAMNT_0042976139 /DNA_START=82 /DNA_END=1338 /DNA_ORIENTATION=-
MDQLKAKAVDATVEAEWLVKIHISIEPDGEENDGQRSGTTAIETLSILQPPDVSVKDVRRYVRRTKNIPGKEQRLFLSGTGVPVIHGPIPPPDATGAVRLSLRRVRLDPRLEALYEMVGMDDVKERHEHMQLMMRPRPARGCYCGRDDSMVPLRVEGDAADTTAGDEAGAGARATAGGAPECAKCLFREVPGQTSRFGIMAPGGGYTWIELRLLACAECQFALCTSCHRNDDGWAAPADPYAALEEKAVKLGRKMASIGCWFGGRGHLCGHPSVTVDDGPIPRRHRTDMKSETDRSSRHGIVVNGPRQVLHRGVRLRVRLTEAVRRTLEENGVDYCKVEFNKVLPDGATIEDVISYRDALSRTHHAWGVVAKDLEDKHPFYETRDGDRARAFPTHKLVSFGLEEAVIELGADISDGDY